MPSTGVLSASGPVGLPGPELGQALAHGAPALGEVVEHGRDAPTQLEVKGARRRLGDVGDRSTRAATGAAENDLAHGHPDGGVVHSGAAQRTLQARGRGGGAGPAADQRLAQQHGQAEGVVVS